MHYASGIRLAMTFAAVLTAAIAHAETPADFLASFEQSARSGNSSCVR
ncbi:MAG TPA: hypothetical protein VGA88_06185 [Burkholderiales bacterium]|jgi:hypothetical protein